MGRLSPYLHHYAEQSAHKLAGVLGMFDRQVRTNLAREIETLMQNSQVLLAQEKRRFISLVADLDSLLALEEKVTSPFINGTEKLLFISPELKLDSELQQRAASVNLGWKQIDNIETAKTWLTTHSPYLVVLDIDAINQERVYLALMNDLGERTPAISVLVLSKEESLLDRLAVVRAGATSFLLKPISSAQLWQNVTQLLQRDRSGETSILVVDDDPIFLATLPPLLEPWGIRMTALENPLVFWELLQSTKPDY